MKASGINIYLGWYDDLETTLKVLDAAQKTGVKMITSCKDLLSVGTAEEVVKAMMNHPALYAYHLKDEPEVIRVYQEQIVKWGMIYQSRAVSLSQGDATERFEWFCKEYPGMVDVVNNRYIASFLGITPVTLSRLRHGVATKVGREKRTDEE